MSGLDHETDIEYLLSTAQRLSAIEIAATSHFHPSLRRRSSSSKTKRYRTSSCKFKEATLTLTISNRTPRFTTTAPSMYPHSCSISILVDAEPPFCFGAAIGDEILGAKVALEINNKISNGSITTGGNKSSRTSLLELVALCDKVCTDLVTIESSSTTTTATSPVSSSSPSLSSTSLSLTNALVLSLRTNIWTNISTHNSACRMTLALLDLSSKDIRGNTLSDPNPFSDSLLSKDDCLTRLKATINMLLKLPKDIQAVNTLSLESIEFLAWMVCPDQGSRMHLRMIPNQFVSENKVSSNVPSQSVGETKTQTTSSATSATSATPTTPTTTTSVTPISTSTSTSTSTSKTPNQLLPRWSFNVFYDSDSPKFDRMSKEFGIVKGYHGTDAQNVYSCLQNGLLQMSGSTMEKNGAAFGDGVYLSEILSVSLFYANPWTPTARFQNFFPERIHSSGFRFVFECDVINDPTHRAFKDSDGKPLKDSYLVVQDSKQLRITKLLIFDALRQDVCANDLHNLMPDPKQEKPGIRQRQVVQRNGASVDADNDLPNESSAENNVAPSITTPTIDVRANGDDTRSRLICCVVVAVLWYLFYLATERMYSKSNKFTKF